MDKTIIIAIISSGALSTLVSALFNVWQARKKRKDGVRAGMKMLLYDRIKHLGKSYIERGSIITDELEDLVEMHSIYHEDLDGNGFLDAIMASVKALPIK
ncbi:MAG: hypothetical protein IIV67_05495 [Bacteroidaceae bacterium]|nr:hypothetical protein [Bacteroidaceae bacterium]